MRRGAAATGSAVFFLCAPGTVAGVVPGWLTQWWRVGSEYVWPVRVLGSCLVVAGAGVVAFSFARFVIEGLGTPAPIAAPVRLVVGGLYRYVRNPMYVGVLAAVAGQALVLGRPVLWSWFAALSLAFGAFVTWYEQPKLAATFGDDYARYCRSVRAWIPRMTPYRG